MTGQEMSMERGNIQKLKNILYENKEVIMVSFLILVLFFDISYHCFSNFRNCIAVIQLMDMAKSWRIDIYKMKDAVLGSAASLAGLYFAAISFAFNCLENKCLGITLNEIYEFKYGRPLSYNNIVLRYTLIIICVGAGLNLGLTVFVCFFYMVIECMDECKRMVLIFDKKAQKKYIKDKVLLEVFEEGKRDGEYPFARKIFFSESKDIETRKFIEDIYSELMQERNLAKLVPEQYFLLFSEITKGVWTADLYEKNEMPTIKNRFLLNMISYIGKRIQMGETGKEGIIRCLSAELGIITAILTFSGNQDIYILEYIFSKHNSDKYFKNYQWAIIQAVGILFELQYQSGKKIEPIFTYLLEKGFVYEMLHKNAIGNGSCPKNMERLWLLLCVNFSALSDYTYGFILKTYMQVRQEYQGRQKQACETYLGIRGFWKGGNQSA